MTERASHEWAAWGGVDQYAALGCEHMSAPNRYRKLFKGAGTVADQGDNTAIVCEGSAAFQLMFANSPELQAEAEAMAARDWPEKASRFVGLEPHINLCDVVLVWRSL